MIVFRVIPGGGMGYEKSLDAESVTIGRSRKCSLTIDDFSLSREHARIFRKDDGWFVEDLGSRNGTFLKGEKVAGARPVGLGDGLAMGNCMIIIEALPLPGGQAPITTTDKLGTRAVLRSASDILKTLAPGGRDEGPTAQTLLKRYAERLQLMQEAHQALARTVALQDLLEMILDRVFLHLKPDEAAVFLRSDGGAIERAAARTSRPGTGTLLTSQTLIDEVINKGQAALVEDVMLDQRFDQAKSVRLAGVRSLVAAPLLDADGTLGMIVLCSRAAVRKFDEGDMEVLAFLASAAALRIRNMALAGEAEKRRLLENELILARRIQEAVLPKRLPDLPGYELHAVSLPSRVVSGDFYQVLIRDEETECVLFVADVSGKGISAALLTTSLEALCSVPIEAGHTPDRIFAQVSALLYRRTPPADYATGVLAVLERETGALRYANAGHCPPLLLGRAGRVVPIESTGAPLGLLPDSTYATGETTLEPGGMLVLYTDGITEAVNAAGEEYGEERLAMLCRRYRDQSPAILADALQRDLEAFVQGVPFADDRTVVILRRTEGADGGRGEP